VSAPANKRLAAHGAIAHFPNNLIIALLNSDRAARSWPGRNNERRLVMYWLVFNFITVTLTALILPSIVRYVVLKRPLNKIASVLIVAVNVVLIIILWIFLRDFFLPVDQARGTPTYLLLGTTLGIVTAWAILTKQDSDGNNSGAEQNEG
jgi:hypothetical protein